MGVNNSTVMSKTMNVLYVSTNRKKKIITWYLIFNLSSNSLQSLLFTLGERKFVGYGVSLSNEGPFLFVCQQEGSGTLQFLHKQQSWAFVRALKEYF